MEYYEGDPHRYSFQSRGPINGYRPVEVGKEYEVVIRELSRRGDGIARIGGFVVFVPKAKTGERVKIRISRVSARFASAEIAQTS